MKAALIASLFLALGAGVVCAQPIATTNASTNTVIKLWPDGAPGALGTADKDVPTLTVFLASPEKATGAAIVICPGGGYTGLAMPHEGENYARWLNELGISAFVLKYRLGSAGYRHPVMLNDASRAMRIVRSRAEEWKIDSTRIGIMGSSAGGHLASTLLTHFDVGNTNSDDPIERVSSRPNLGILCYAVITMGPGTHGGSRQNLLGNNPSQELIAELSNELHVTKDTPPCFVWHTLEDTTVPVKNSIDFGAALAREKVPSELHIYQKGRHGIGLGGTGAYEMTNHHRWVEDCAVWLREQKFAK